MRRMMVYISHVAPGQAETIENNQNSNDQNKFYKRRILSSVRVIWAFEIGICFVFRA